MGSNYAEVKLALTACTRPDRSDAGELVAGAHQDAAHTRPERSGSGQGR